MQMQREGLVFSSEASYCDRETWEDWGSRSSLPLSQLDEVATSSSVESVAALKAERAALARSLDAERQRAAAQARAHEARLAELHGVIAELMRRREVSAHQQIVEETSEHTDECESTTQPAGELDNDADLSRTDQNDTSSRLSVDPQLPAEDTSEDIPVRVSVQESSSCERDALECVKGTALSERDSDKCLSTARCCGAGSSGDRPHSHNDTPTHTAKTGRCESREAKVACRVRLRKTEEGAHSTDDAWCAAMAERLSLDVCAQADLREALVAASTDASSLQSLLAASQARISCLEAELHMAECARDNARDTAHRLWTACACHESSTVSLCAALNSADRALEAYDVLLALAETEPCTPQRESSEEVARTVLSRLEDSEPSIGDNLLSPGPWLQHTPLPVGLRCAANFDIICLLSTEYLTNENTSDRNFLRPHWSIGLSREDMSTFVAHPSSQPAPAWSPAQEAKLRAHVARLKAETAELRATLPLPLLFSYHDNDDETPPPPVNPVSMVDMEAAVLMQEVQSARSERAAILAALSSERARLAALAAAFTSRECSSNRKSSSTRSRRRHPREERHWLEASETDL